MGRKGRAQRKAGRKGQKPKANANKSKKKEKAEPREKATVDKEAFVVKTLLSSKELQVHFSRTLKGRRCGAITEALGQLFQEAANKGSTNRLQKVQKLKATRPTKLLEALRRACPIFKGKRQHDAQELLSMMVRKLMEEEVKFLQSDVDADDSLPLDEKIRSTYFFKLLHGSFLGSLSCKSCGFVKSDKEEYLDISIPIVKPLLVAMETSTNSVPSMDYPCSTHEGAMLGPSVQESIEETLEDAALIQQSASPGADAKIEVSGDAWDGSDQAQANISQAVVGFTAFDCSLGVLSKDCEDDCIMALDNNHEKLVGSSQIPTSEQEINGSIERESPGPCFEKPEPSEADLERDYQASNTHGGRGDRDTRSSTKGGCETLCGNEEPQISPCSSSNPEANEEFDYDSDGGDGLFLLSLFDIGEDECASEEEGLWASKCADGGKGIKKQALSSACASNKALATAAIDTIDECLDFLCSPEDVRWKCPQEFPERRIHFSKMEPQVFVIPKGDPCHFYPGPGVFQQGLGRASFFSDEEDDFAPGPEDYTQESWTDIFPLKTAEGLKSILKKERKHIEPPVEEDDTPNSVKQSKIWSTPNLLYMHLKRFKVSARGRMTKLNQHVQFGMELDLQSVYHPDSPDKDRCRYSLRGVVCHSGSISGGHYAAYVLRESPNRQWFYTSDEEVHPVSESRVLAAQAYILMYERQHSNDVDRETDSHQAKGEHCAVAKRNPREGSEKEEVKDVGCNGEVLNGEEVKIGDDNGAALKGEEESMVDT